MTNLRLVELLQLQEDKILRLKQLLQEIEKEYELDDKGLIDTIYEQIDCVIGLKHLAIKTVDYWITNKFSTEEKAVSYAVSVMQDVAIISGIRVSTKDREELVEIITKAYKEKSDINSN